MITGKIVSTIPNVIRAKAIFASRIGITQPEFLVPPNHFGMNLQSTKYLETQKNLIIIVLNPLAFSMFVSVAVFSS